ncbi:uncharacterized protein LOC130629472 [Hydractinia symbiolongicarpus]|uniref:uncharacterized protein LOC130629472 n=1 Tax=Hydractinia symbiolongicarpus TaxID=13093 RepID=UPI00254E2ABE|nr:uncharacterized protein LOC130629472 [Hydractinia symbiolongicarpus]XP_057298670.1 uncharacterized protein LOC130629472 [Hydractinia symbiolongicarpus]
MPLAVADVLLPKQVCDSCYASLTQIYNDMFQLTPKSNLKNALTKTNSNGLDVNVYDASQAHRRSNKLLNLGSFRKSIPQESDVKDTRKSDKRISKKQKIYKSIESIPTWVENDSKSNIVGTSIEFVTKF